jgi:Family of unknown function (DUF6101)
LRRQAASRALPAGSSRDERLDPFSLPLRFATDAGSTAAPVRILELHSDHVVLMRARAGIKMTIALPLHSYLGIALHLQPRTVVERACAAIVLEHPDPQLSVTLHHARDAHDISFQWRCWARALGLPLLIVESDGSVREPFPRIGAIEVGRTAARRRGRSTLKSRRGIQRLRRRTGSLASAAVHRGEREIIARN